MKKIILAVFLWVIIGMTVFLPSVSNANALNNHASPYLAMHGDDPVDWMEWGNAALKKARKENKLLFVSIGYFACHWCHVMHKESYANAGIAKKLNADYIPIKVDRELSPVLDKRLIEFVSATNGHAGWPLNVFITPEGIPLVGATYIPRDSFSKALTNLAQQWKKDSEQLKSDANALNETLQTALNGQEIKGSKKHVSDNSVKLVAEIMSSADNMQGGFGEQMKFPSSPQLHALFQLNQQHQDPDIDKFIHLTLDAMSKRGLHDELAGGFYRYTVDQGWNTPHFEKMLYNNAMLPILYLEAADYYKNETYRETALETLAFLQEFMQDERHKTGAFIASLSAVDDKDVEGGYYLWSQDELKKILNSDELKLANAAWGMNETAELEAGILPMMQSSVDTLAKQFKIPPKDLTDQLKQLKLKLKDYRTESRKLPRDHKLLTAWNGLALAAFAKALKSDQKLKPQGQQLASFLMSLWNGKKLKRAADSNEIGTLSDYAASSWGLLSWAQASNDSASKELGITLAKYAWTHFYKNQIWQEAEEQLLPEGVQNAHLTDEPYPSAETLLIRASFLANTAELKGKAQQAISFSTKSIESNPYSYASLIAVAYKYKLRLNN